MWVKVLSFICNWFCTVQTRCSTCDCAQGSVRGEEIGRGGETVEKAKTNLIAFGLCLFFWHHGDDKVGLSRRWRWRRSPHNRAAAKRKVFEWANMSCMQLFGH